jgi:pimeloyl-ACP methyl ester carboxylesterase
MKSIAGWSGTPAHDANPSFRAPQVDIEKFERVFPGFLDTVKDLHRHMYGPAYWRRFLEQTSQLWLTLPSYSDDALASIPVPTLVLTGDRDEEPLAQAPRLYRTIPQLSSPSSPAPTMPPWNGPCSGMSSSTSWPATAKRHDP